MQCDSARLSKVEGRHLLNILGLHISGLSGCSCRLLGCSSRLTRAWG